MEHLPQALDAIPVHWDQYGGMCWCTTYRQKRGMEKETRRGRVRKREGEEKFREREGERFEERDTEGELESEGKKGGGLEREK
ncbi:hypothetical protein NFI96_021042 [Prochilodus magdalenae]|nr:hypothetical protein NFI96_021042 [Prochilodus magdalenae]